MGTLRVPVGVRAVLPRARRHGGHRRSMRATPRPRKHSARTLRVCWVRAHATGGQHTRGRSGAHSGRVLRRPCAGRRRGQAADETARADQSERQAGPRAQLRGLRGFRGGARARASQPPDRHVLRASRDDLRLDRPAIWHVRVRGLRGGLRGAGGGRHASTGRGSSRGGQGESDPRRPRARRLEKPQARELLRRGEALYSVEEKNKETEQCPGVFNEEGIETGRKTAIEKEQGAPTCAGQPGTEGDSLTAYGSPIGKPGTSRGPIEPMILQISVACELDALHGGLFPARAHRQRRVRRARVLSPRPAGHGPRRAPRRPSDRRELLAPTLEEKRFGT